MLFMLIVSNIAMAVIFMLVYGLATNIQNLTLNIIWVKYFGRKYLGSIRGAATVFGVLGSAFGTIPFGLSYDLTGSYVAVFTVMAIITFAALGMALSIKRPKRA
jgi:predicted MFS family arabinose efflux permease